VGVLRIGLGVVLLALGACATSPPAGGSADAAAPADAAGASDGPTAPRDAAVDAPPGADAAPADAAGADAGDGAAAADGPVTAACLAGQYVNPAALGPDYDQFQPVIGSHCKGTNHQEITGVERVVFLGDSVTVGTPPTNLNPGAVYRAILARQLAVRFNLPAPGPGWGGADPLNGVAFPASSGAFTCCAKWGARTDDLMQDHHQVEDCIPPDQRQLHHLVVMTMGGNDIDAITQDGGGTSPQKTIPELWQDTERFVGLLRDTIQWLKDPANVPGGVDVVFANLHEFTDATGDVNACPAAALAGIQPWTDHQAQVDMVVWANEQYLKTAVDYGADMVFMLEAFCGHGFKRDDPASPCYRGPGQDLWFDATCIHPNAAGHAALADLFYSVIAE
jgi:lysophospholipase L1-like esterase